MFEIELAEPRYSTCECCGGSMTNLTRFVAKDGNPFAIYHATFADNHRESGVLAAIGIDDNWETVESENRVGFACRLWVNTWFRLPTRQIHHGAGQKFWAECSIGTRL